MTIPDGVRKLLDMYDTDENRLMLLFHVVPDDEFISKYGTQALGMIQLEVPESINKILEKETN